MTKTEYTIEQAMLEASELELASKFKDMRQAIKDTRRADLLELFDSLFANKPAGRLQTPRETRKTLEAYKRAKLNWSTPGFKQRLAEARAGTSFANPLYSQDTDSQGSGPYAVVSQDTDALGNPTGKPSIWRFDSEWAATLTFQEEEADWLRSHAGLGPEKHGTKWSRRYTYTLSDGTTLGWTLRLTKTL